MSKANPFQRPGESAQKTGRRFERFFANLFGVDPQRGSGNLWYAKMDVGDGAMLWNLKFSEQEVLRFGKYRVRDLLREAEQAINGQGGVGGSIIPGVAIAEEDGEVFVSLRAEDFLRIVRSDVVTHVVPSRGEQKRQRARVPALLRDEDDDGA